MHQVICAFTGVGKTQAAKQYPDLVIDYQLTADDPIEHIKYLVSQGKVVLLPTDPKVMDHLGQEGINFAILYPALELRDEYLQRFVERGDDTNHIGWLSSCWTDLYFACDDRSDGSKYVIRKCGYTVVDFLSDLSLT